MQLGGWREESADGVQGKSGGGGGETEGGSACLYVCLCVRDVSSICAS